MQIRQGYPDTSQILISGGHEAVPTSCPQVAAIGADRTESGQASTRPRMAWFRGFRPIRNEEDRTSLGSNPTVTATKIPDQRYFRVALICVCEQICEQISFLGCSRFAL
ncbi:hypothetical protein NQ152_16040, partial [Microbacterium sp. zg.B48]|uniref:hypothetical protein n=1 Tax=Microbacterium sp. zg.B48 TaxID=2969408 RepID=UPI00214AD66C